MVLEKFISGELFLSGHECTANNETQELIKLLFSWNVTYKLEGTIVLCYNIKIEVFVVFLLFLLLDFQEHCIRHNVAISAQLEKIEKIYMRRPEQNL